MQIFGRRGTRWFWAAHRILLRAGRWLHVSSWIISTFFQTLLPSFSFCTRTLKAVWNITILSVDIFRVSNMMVSAITEDRPCSFVAIEMIARKYNLYLGISITLLHSTVSFFYKYFVTYCFSAHIKNIIFVEGNFAYLHTTFNSEPISRDKNNFMSIFTLLGIERKLS